MEIAQETNEQDGTTTELTMQSAAEGIDLAGTVAEFLTFMSGIRNASALTLTAYATDIRLFLVWCEAQGIPLRYEALTRDILFRYLTSLGHLGTNTVRRRIHGLSSWCGYLVDIGELETNPARGLPLPRRERKLPDFPTPAQANQLLQAARSPLENVAIWLLMTTGLRRAELVSLDLDDLSADGSELRVCGKGDLERLVPVPERTQQVLAEYLQERGRDPGPLLRNKVGNRLGYTSLRRMFNRLLRRAGLEDCGFTLHSTRHGFATMLVRSGVDLGTVRDLLGHSDISITSVYVHSDLRSKKTAVEQLPILAAGGGVDD